MYIRTLRTYSDNCMRYLNYINGGSFFESVDDPVGGRFTIYYEADDDPDPDVSKAEDDENPEVSDSNDDENPEVSTSDDNDSSTSSTSTSNDGSSSDSDGTDDSSNDSSSDDTSNDNDDSSSSSDSDDSDDNDSSDSSDSGSSDSGSSDDDSNSEDGSNDMDSDPHSVSGDDENPDASSGDDSKSSDNNNGDDKKEDKPGTDFENMRRYNLYKKFMSLNDSINGYTDTLDALVYDDDTLNAVTKTASQKLKQLSEIMYDYMTMKFENDSYTQALLFYHEINAGVRMCFDLLESGNANIRK